MEAESGVLTGTLVDTNWQPWSGSGVVGFFDSVGDRMVWPLSVPAGSYQVVFRFANGSPGSAVRSVTVNGAVVGSVSFVRTGAWNSYQLVSSVVSLPAGAAGCAAGRAPAFAGSVPALATGPADGWGEVAPVSG